MNFKTVFLFHGDVLAIVLEVLMTCISSLLSFIFQSILIHFFLSGDLLGQWMEKKM